MSEAPASPPKIRIFFPILFAIFPILSLYSANLALVPIQSIFRPSVFVVGAVVFLWFLSQLALKSVGRGAVLSSKLVLFCFLYSRMVAAISIPNYVGYLYPWIWAFITIIGTGLATWKLTCHKLLNVLSLALVATAVGQIGMSVFQSASLRPVIPIGDRTSGGNIAVRPDIIYIILDGFGRSDALKRALNYSSDSFVEGLEKRGFYVAKDSRANYCQTELSVGSSLNMDFLPQLLPKIAMSESNRSPLDTIIEFNQVARYLKDRGYIFSAITTGFPPLQFEHADVNLRSQVGLNLIESALLQMTPFTAIKVLQGSMYERRRETILEAFIALESLSSKALGPRFTIVHILAPHPPFVFGANGERMPHKGAFGFWDGSDYIQNVSSAKDYRDGYAGQAQFIGDRMLRALDSLFSGSGEKPIVLIQGDHGSKLRLDQDSLQKTDINECFPNLSAFLVPDSVRKNLYPGISPVNSFRLLFNGLFDAKFELKPDKSWYSTFPEPYRFTEVTNQIADHSSMPSVPLPR